jgi:hypothetical protein
MNPKLQKKITNLASRPNEYRRTELGNPKFIGV